MSLDVAANSVLDLQVTISEGSPSVDAGMASGNCTDTCHTQPNCLVADES